MDEQTNLINSQEGFENRIDLTDLNQSAQKLTRNISDHVIGQHDMIEKLLIAILANGHVLLEGVPGVAKTLTAKLVAKSISAHFSRIQFTPDLMPSDIIGTMVYNMGKASFSFKQGPLFANVVLVDEINRAPAKTQAALFEAMEERQITVDGTTYALDPPFLVFATQNPIEQEGTYRLPEAQMDRFMLKIEVDYPNLEEEIQILETQAKGSPNIQSVETLFSSEAIGELQEKIRHIYISPELQRYIAQIVTQTRKSSAIFLGASPRASLALMQTAKARAAIYGKDFVTPEDIQEMAPSVLNHRIVLTAEKEMEGISPKKIIKQLIAEIEIPR